MHIDWRLDQCRAPPRNPKGGSLVLLGTVGEKIDLTDAKSLNVNTDAHTCTKESVALAKSGSKSLALALS